MAQLTIGVVVLFSIWWQGYLYTKDIEHDEMPKRLVVPIAIVAVLFFITALYAGGSIVYSAIGLLRADIQDFNPRPMIFLLLRLTVIALLFAVKSYLGPLSTGIVVAISIYLFAEHGEIRIVPVLAAVLDWALQGASQMAHWTYQTIVLLYLISMSALDSLDVG